MNNKNLTQHERPLVQTKEKISALEVAKFFLSLDTGRRYFNKEKMKKVKGNSTPTTGNLRLNKLLQITQMLYATKHGQYLFPEKMLAFEYGGVVYEVYRRFHFLVDSQSNLVAKDLTAYLKTFLTKIFNYFESYSNEQLECFVHEDPAWFTIWKSEDIKGRKEMPQSLEMIKYYQEFASHISEKLEL